MSPIVVTSLTNFALAAETLLLGGLLARRPKQRGAASWYWAGVLLLLGLGALIGGIDHGFLDPAGPAHRWVQRLTWIVLAGMTFCLLLSTARQFFPPRAQRVWTGIAIAQFLADAAAILSFDSFLDVILNYAPVMLLLLTLNLLGLRRGAGSRGIIGGLLVMAAASVIQALGFDALNPLDHNGLYHVVSMAGVLFLFSGGRRLKKERMAES